MSILDQFKLTDKVALVTGAARGLGQGMALALAEAGAHIVAVDIIDAAETKAKVEALGRKCIFVTGDLSQGPEAAQKVVDAAIANLGTVDILVNNAGIIRRTDFLEFSKKDWDDVMKINIDAVFFLSQSVGRVMAKQGSGRIINIASMLAFQGGVRVPSYAASKSAVAGLTRLMACELGPKGINTNAIAPGYMATDNTTALREDAARNQAILDRIPLGRWGTPADLMGMVVFLASPASSYCNGFIYAVDGGWLAR